MYIAPMLHRVCSRQHICAHDKYYVIIQNCLALQAPLALCLWDSLKPQYDPDASTRLARPVQYNVDEELNIDDIMDNIASVRNIGMRR